jgi:hypothetical protein
VKINGALDEKKDIKMLPPKTAHRTSVGSLFRKVDSEDHGQAAPVLTDISRLNLEAGEILEMLDGDKFENTQRRGSVVAKEDSEHDHQKVFDVSFSLFY